MPEIIDFFVRREIQKLSSGAFAAVQKSDCISAARVGKRAEKVFRRFGVAVVRRVGAGIPGAEGLEGGGHGFLGCRGRENCGEGEVVWFRDRGMESGDREQVARLLGGRKCRIDLRKARGDFPWWGFCCAALERCSRA